MIEWLMYKSEKEIYKVYTIAMFLVMTLQCIILVWKTNWINGIGLGFNIGLWLGFSLRRLFVK